MLNHIKVLGVVLAIMIAFGGTAFASEEYISADEILNEFINEPPLDDSVLTSEINLEIDETGTIEQLKEAIKMDPENTGYYAKAAELFTGNSEKGIKVFANGIQIDFSLYDNVEPVIEDGRTMVPARALAESLGAVVEWNGETRLITINLGEKVINLTLDSNQALVNGTKVTLDVPAKVINNRTMIPLRFVSEAFGQKVGWHPYEGGGVSVISIVE